MTATLEQTQSDLAKLIDLAQKGEEVLITSNGQPVAKLTGLPQPRTPADRRAWLGKLAGLRARLATGTTGLSVEELLKEDRGV
ncbi:MAG TPA: type II toxin-antitoxin system prevent-host-death family antitoxin [Verrucomicrobiae bacterium]|nr:type II toxin-antitoxin system prevent-host-death family antitoxin [Verrucomicrobiae bacterium]